MDVIVIYNGLGNQMSQYALYMQKKSINKSTYLISLCKTHNKLELDKVFNININQGAIQKFLYLLFRILSVTKLKVIRPLQLLLNFLNCKVVKESFNYEFNPLVLKPSKGITFYYGGWHSDKYFSSVKTQVKEAFAFPLVNDAENLRHIDTINNTISVSLHVRRGDYLSAENVNIYGDVCNLDYYQKAITLVKGEMKEPHFFIFSNDITWVKENLKIENATYIVNNTKQDAWKDVYLMSLCKANIIANSTFSWWAAWLNKHSDKLVISPMRFLKNDTVSDVYPDEWVKIP